MTDPSAGNPEPTAESLEVIRKFAETYAQRTGTYFCSDPGVTALSAVMLKPSAPRRSTLLRDNHYDQCFHSRSCQPAV
jgi:hypothetical protein